METTMMPGHPEASKGLERYVRPKDVIEATGLAKSTVMAALRSGELKGVRYGRAWLVPVSAVEEWLRAGSQRA